MPVVHWEFTKVPERSFRKVPAIERGRIRHAYIFNNDTTFPDDPVTKIQARDIVKKSIERQSDSIDNLVSVANWKDKHQDEVGWHYGFEFVLGSYLVFPVEIRVHYGDRKENDDGR